MSDRNEQGNVGANSSVVRISAYCAVARGENVSGSQVDGCRPQAKAIVPTTMTNRTRADALDEERAVDPRPAFALMPTSRW